MINYSINLMAKILAARNWNYAVKRSDAYAKAGERLWLTYKKKRTELSKEVLDKILSHYDRAHYISGQWWDVRDIIVTQIEDIEDQKIIEEKTEEIQNA